MPRPKRLATAAAPEPEIIVGWCERDDCSRAIVDGRRDAEPARRHWHSPYSGPPRIFVPRPPRERVS